MMTQDAAFSVMKRGRNVFLTGEPGSGKTYTVRRFIQWAREEMVNVAITASTGIASTHLGGSTIHSWSGIGIRDVLTEEDLDKLENNSYLKHRVKSASVLVIDEISMLSATMLEAIDLALCTVRRSRSPFGGLQVIFVGDFFQLPPVEHDPNRPLFAFESNAWKRAAPTCCYLAEQHRQHDPDFCDVLSAIRRAAVTPEHIDLLNSRSSSTAPPHSVKLYSHNVDVDQLNNQELEKLPGRAKRYVMRTEGPPGPVAALIRGCTSPSELTLKKDALVLFTRNDPDHRWVNGTVGVVTGFESNNYPRVTVGQTTHTVDPVSWILEENRKKVAELVQLPLRLAWALTVHKSQGMSLDSVHVDLSRAFAYGQGYVALSRARTLQGLTVAGFNRRALEVHPDVRKLDPELRAQSTSAEVKRRN